MKFLHTADWHIGQVFHEFDRTFEHERFFDWLIETIENENVDVLLLSGDVFDHSNPSAQSVRLFYTFLNRITRRNPNLQIVVIAGNHDSSARLETPKPLLESSNVHIIGLIERKENGEIDYDKLIVPLKNADGVIEVLCLAVPFLRLGDYPSVPGAKSPYTEGVAAFYKEIYERATENKKDKKSLIAMGHLHALNAEISDLDDSERPIMGGSEGVPFSAFHENLLYVALGHIHKAQSIGGRENIRYSGSPIPLSFSEHSYKHQVTVFDIENNELKNLEILSVPLTVPLIVVPERHEPIDRVLSRIDKLETYIGESELAPYLFVKVLLLGPEPSLKFKIEQALEGKNLRLVKIDTKTSFSDNQKEMIIKPGEKLNDLNPKELLKRTFESRYPEAESIPDFYFRLLEETENIVLNREN